MLSAAILMGGAVQGEVTQPRDNPEVGTQICTYGFIMDNFCVERGTLLDASSIKTLENPGAHSVHCLVDVGVCKNSPFHVLEANPPDMSTPYGPGWQVDNNDLLVNNAREIGSCSTCTGSGKQRDGYRAEVVGNVVTVDPPVLSVVQVRELGSSEEGCTFTMDPNNTIAPAPAPASAAVAPRALVSSAISLVAGALIAF